MSSLRVIFFWFYVLILQNTVICEILMTIVVDASYVR